MSNRCFLYSHHPDARKRKFRDLGEWKHAVPLSHLILVGDRPRTCASAIWEVEPEVALRAPSARARPAFLAFLDWLGPQVEPAEWGGRRHGFEGVKDHALGVFLRGDRRGPEYHLEAAEFFDAEGVDVDRMGASAEALALEAGQTFDEACRLVETKGSTLADARIERIATLGRRWPDDLGLSFGTVLYRSLGY